MHMQDS